MATSDATLPEHATGTSLAATGEPMPGAASATPGTSPSATSSAAWDPEVRDDREDLAPAPAGAGAGAGSSVTDTDPELAEMEKVIKLFRAKQKIWVAGLAKFKAAELGPEPAPAIADFLAVAGTQLRFFTSPRAEYLTVESLKKLDHSTRRRLMDGVSTILERAEPFIETMQKLTAMLEVTTAMVGHPVLRRQPMKDLAKNLYRKIIAKFT
jgi:hypothetical protein